MFSLLVFTPHDVIIAKKYCIIFKQTQEKVFAAAMRGSSTRAGGSVLTARSEVLTLHEPIERSSSFLQNLGVDLCESSFTVTLN